MSSIDPFQGGGSGLKAKGPSQGPSRAASCETPVTSDDTLDDTLDDIQHRTPSVRRYTTSGAEQLSPKAPLEPRDAMANRSKSMTLGPSAPRNPVASGQAYVESFVSMVDPAALPKEYAMAVARSLLKVAGHSEGLKVVYGEKSGEFRFGAGHDMLTDVAKPAAHAEMMGCVGKGLAKMPGSKNLGAEVVHNSMKRQASQRTMLFGGTRMRVEHDAEGNVSKILLSASKAYGNKGSPTTQDKVARFYANVLNLAGVAKGVSVELDPTNGDGDTAYLINALKNPRA